MGFLINFISRRNAAFLSKKTCINLGLTCTGAKHWLFFWQRYILIWIIVLIIKLCNIFGALVELICFYFSDINSFLHVVNIRHYFESFCRLIINLSYFWIVPLQILFRFRILFFACIDNLLFFITLFCELNFSQLVWSLWSILFN